MIHPKTFYTNWRDLVLAIAVLIAAYFALAFIEQVSAPTFDSAGNPSGGLLFVNDFAGMVKALAATALVITLPWLLMAVTFPNTLGKFVNDDFVPAWRNFDLQTAPGRKLVCVLSVYAVFVLVGAVVWNGVLS